MAQWAAFGNPGFDLQHKTGHLRTITAILRMEAAVRSEVQGYPRLQRESKGKPELKETVLRIELNEAVENNSL